MLKIIIKVLFQNKPKSCFHSPLTNVPLPFLYPNSCSPCNILYKGKGITCIYFWCHNGSTLELTCQSQVLSVCSLTFTKNMSAKGCKTPSKPPNLPNFTSGEALYKQKNVLLKIFSRYHLISHLERQIAPEQRIWHHLGYKSWWPYSIFVLATSRK